MGLSEVSLPRFLSHTSGKLSPTWITVQPRQHCTGMLTLQPERLYIDSLVIMTFMSYVSKLIIPVYYTFQDAWAWPSHDTKTSRCMPRSDKTRNQTTSQLYKVNKVFLYGLLYQYLAGMLKQPPVLRNHVVEGGSHLHVTSRASYKPRINGKVKRNKMKTRQNETKDNAQPNNWVFATGAVVASYEHWAIIVANLDGYLVSH